MTTVSVGECHYIINSDKEAGPVHFSSPVAGFGSGVQPILSRSVGVRLLSFFYDPKVPNEPIDTAGPYWLMRIVGTDYQGNYKDTGDIVFSLGLKEITVNWQWMDVVLLTSYNAALELGMVKPGGLDTEGQVKFHGYEQTSKYKWEFKLVVSGCGKWRHEDTDNTFVEKFLAMTETEALQNDNWEDTITQRVTQQNPRRALIDHESTGSEVGLPGITFFLPDDYKSPGSDGLLWEPYGPLHLLHELPVLGVERYDTVLPLYTEPPRVRKAQRIMVSIRAAGNRSGPIRPLWGEVIARPGVVSSPSVYVLYDPVLPVFHAIINDQHIALEEVNFKVKMELADGRFVDVIQPQGVRSNLKIGLC